jgi:MFS transporter, AAHS family, 4-hydroxybenzoate transporter
LRLIVHAGIIVRKPSLHKHLGQRNRSWTSGRHHRTASPPRVAGAQVGINALAAGYYPTASRATGVSWANAIGRTGSVLGSMIGGVLLSLGWDLAMVFAAAALPAFLAALAMLAKGWFTRAAKLRAAPAAVATPAE